MTLDDVMRIVDRLSPEERDLLREYLDKQQLNPGEPRTGTMNVDVLTEAARAIREGFTDEEWDEIEAAMNDARSYVESCICATSALSEPDQIAV